MDSRRSDSDLLAFLRKLPDHCDLQSGYEGLRLSGESPGSSLDISSMR